jgi:hypothetical protein
MLEVIVVVALLMMIPLYFESRASKEPSGTERFFARIWLIVRRSLCFVAALMFGAVAIAGLLGLFGIVKAAPPWHMALFSAAVAAALVWWGVFGAGRSKGFSDDRPEHERRKHRYGWRK